MIDLFVQFFLVLPRLTFSLLKKRKRVSWTVFTLADFLCDSGPSLAYLYDVCRRTDIPNVGR